MELKRKRDILIESDSTKNSFQKKMFYFNGSYGPLIFLKLRVSTFCL